MKKLFFVALAVMLFHGSDAAQVLINEFSQGSSGSKEYIEFVVQGQRNCSDSCGDIRGWIFDDNNGWYGTGASSAGYYRFKNEAVWSCVPYGSIIVLYNPDDVNPAVPPDDVSDANHDHVYVLPINAATIEFNPGVAYSNSGFGPSLNWNGLVLNNTNDAVQIINPSNLVAAAHAVSYGSTYYAPVNIAPSGAGQTVYYLTNSQYNTTAAWAKGNVSAYQTPGQPNTPANAAWLNGMNVNQGVTKTVTRFDTLCSNQLPYYWNGFTIATPGSSSQSFTTTSVLTGCDSTTVLNLLVMPAATLMITDTAACGQVLFEDVVYTSSQIVYDTLYNRRGCDSIWRKINVVIYPVGTAHEIVDTFGCGSVVFEGKIYHERTTLEDHFVSVHGCDSLDRTVHISVSDFHLDLTMQPDTPFAGELIVFNTASDKDYAVTSWQLPSLFNQQQLKEQRIIARQGETVTVTAISAEGCIDSVTLTYTVMPLRYDVFVPNAFSPNDDGLNDVFKPYPFIKRAYVISRMQVVDRWGASVYHSTGNDVQWDGRYGNGTPAESGIYHYFIVIRFLDGREEMFKGDVTLIR
jgi:gliding motility-associated-like protein